MYSEIAKVADEMKSKTFKEVFIFSEKITDLALLALLDSKNQCSFLQIQPYNNHQFFLKTN
jgi:hypothetical protein